MAWDIERTKQLLLESATQEFCDHGLAGARVDRIAGRAGVNKERIYQYFGKKEELFGTVIARVLVQLGESMPFRGTGPEAVAEYAGLLFDRHVADRTTARLLFWEGLERGGDSVTSAERIAHHSNRVDGVLQMLPGISREEAAELVLTIVGLCVSWVTLPQLDALFATAGENADRVAQRRAAIVDTIRLVARARVEGVATGD